MDFFEYSPRIKQLAAVLMRLYPKFRLDIFESSVRIVFSYSVAYRFSFDEEGSVDCINESTRGHRRNPGILNLARMLYTGCWSIPNEVDLTMKVYDELRNGDVKKDIEFFDRNYETYRSIQTAYKWKNRTILILGLLLFVSYSGSRHSLFSRKYAIVENALRTVSEWTGIQSIEWTFLLLVGVLVVFNTLFGLYYDRKRRKCFSA